MSKTILGNFTNGRDNNLNSLRLIAAFLVLYSHTVGMVSLQSQNWPFYYSSIGRIGVNTFFIISGFLVTQSFLNTGNAIKYLWARCLRIYPALIVIIILTAFVLGPFVTNLSVSSYFVNIGTYSYLLNMTGIWGDDYLPGVFSENQFTTMVNNSLWTLRYELLYYEVQSKGVEIVSGSEYSFC